MKPLENASSKASPETKQQPECELVTITPALAAEWLEKNYPKNRKICKNRVAVLVDQIKRGQWQLNGATIVFNSEGFLSDGQHRLTAVVKANRPIQSMVVRGLEPKTFHTIDTGKSRTNADILHIAGEASSIVLACAARLIMEWERHKDFGERLKGRVPFHDVNAILRRHPGLRDAVRECSGSAYSTDLRGMGPSFIAAFYYLASIVNRDEAVAFYTHLFKGTDLSAGHPVLALRRYVIELGRESGRRFQPRETGRWFIKTWNLWARGERVGAIKPVATEALDHLETPVKNWMVRYGITYDSSKAAAPKLEKLEKLKDAA